MITEQIVDSPFGQIGIIKNHSNPISESWLAFHGWLDNAASFLPMMQTGMCPPITAIDLPGHGLTYHRAPNHFYHFIDYVSDIENILSALNIDQPIKLLGHSLGGLISNIFAGLHPSQVSQMVLIDAAGTAFHNMSNPVEDIRKGLASRQKFRLENNNSLPKLEVLLAAKMKVNDISKQHAQLIIDRNTYIDHSGKRYWKSDQKLKASSPLKMNLDISEAILKEIACPTLICIGKKTRSDIASNIKKFSRSINNVKIIDIDGGHHCHMNHPEQLISAINQFSY